MVQPIDIAIEVHKICESIAIPRGFSPAHDVGTHAATTAIYAEGINSRGFGHIAGKEAVEAIVEAAGWDMDSPWPGHPSVEKVLEKLND